MRCARCYNKFYPNREYESLCYDCYSDACPYGDMISHKMWRGVSLLINTKFSMDDLKELADSKAFCEFAKEVFREKDLDTKLLYFKQLIKEAKS